MVREQELQQAINQKCLECCCGSHNEVRDCRLKACALHQYRPFQRVRTTGNVAAGSRRCGDNGKQIDVFEVLQYV